ncbi:zinc-ribbon domain-containing protein [Terribacillus saccharophilus]|uniref:zinc ribbon domain-containing protein n=1 Tax=Terribacillus saccharophilus TaxID=361277 RepID=UPI0039824368
MNYCKECGKELKPDAQFCNNCGTSITSSPTPQRQQQPAPKKKMSKKNKIILASVIAVLVILFAGYKTGEAMTSKEKVIDKFETALAEKDAKKLAKILSTDDKDLTITEDSVKSLITYYDEHPEDLDYLISDMKSQTEESVAYASGPVHLSMDGKKYLLYDNYEINVRPYYITMATDYKDTVLKVDGHEVGTADKDAFEKTYGPFLPGTHEVAATLAHDVVEMSTSESLDLYSEATKTYTSLQLDGSVNDDIKKPIMEQINAVGDQIAHAKAAKDTSFLKDAGKPFKQTVQDEIDDLDYWGETTYQGSYLSTEFDMDSFHAAKLEAGWVVKVDVSQTFNEDEIYDGDSADLEKETHETNYTMLYDEKAKKWQVYDADYTYFSAENPETMENKKPTVYKADGTDNAKSKTANTDEESDIPDTAVNLMDNYLNGLIEAINGDDFGSVSPYMEDGSALYKSQQTLVDNLTSKNITESLDSYEIASYEEDGDTATITTKETVTISYSDGTSETQDYDWTYTAKKSGGQWKLTNIE